MDIFQFTAHWSSPCLDSSLCQRGGSTGSNKWEINSNMILNLVLIFLECVSNTLQRSLPKKSSRRNPWGNYSYSDIIAQVGIPIVRSGLLPHNVLCPGNIHIPWTEADLEWYLWLDDFYHSLLQWKAGQCCLCGVEGEQMFWLEATATLF